MKLWIRNMWKHGLYEVNGVVAMENGDKWQITDCRYVLPLGEYTTRERCLEIIDEIQDALCGNVSKYKGTGFVNKAYIEPIGENIVAVVNKEIIELPHHDTFVYEMPEN